MTLNEMLKAEVEKMNIDDVKFVAEEQMEVGCGFANTCGKGPIGQ